MGDYTSAEINYIRNPTRVSVRLELAKTFGYPKRCIRHASINDWPSTCIEEAKSDSLMISERHDEIIDIVYFVDDSINLIAPKIYWEFKSNWP